MTGLLQGESAWIFEAKSREELFTEVVRFAHRLEFETISATVVIDRFSAEPEFIAVDNTPAGFLDTFIDTNKGRQDPVCQHCKNSSLPIVWDQSTYVRAGKGAMWEHQARFGYR